MSEQKADTEYRGVDDIYRENWTWDKVAWASHCIDCYPGNCPMRVYVKDGIAWREESAAVFPQIEEGVPDLNPMGCQKGVGWTRTLYGKERVLYPLKRVGERGEGKWQRVSWTQAATEIADAVLDAVEEIGPESVIAPSGCNTHTWGGLGRGLYMGSIGGLIMDVNAEMNDLAPGHYITYGAFDPVSSIDDWFHADIILIWNGNPVYTRIPHYHFIAEARYKGAEIYTIAPDVSPSAVHADYHVGLRPGSDAAFALSMVQVVIEENLIDEQFAKEQTDLTLLMNPATKRYLRESDMEEGGSDEQFYVWDLKAGTAVKAPRDTLFWGDVDPALTGSFMVTTLAGDVELGPVLSEIIPRLDQYKPELAEEICNVHPDTIRKLARKIASKRTKVVCSLSNAGKHYHGDLMERAQLLLFGLTGNWGKQGTGVQAWTAGMLEGNGTIAFKQNRGPEEVFAMADMTDAAFEAAKEADPTLTRSIWAIEAAKVSAKTSNMIPPIFYWYRHAGNREAWQNRAWHDPSMKREFDEYFQEAVESGWWEGLDVPREEHIPRVLIECGGNVLRRTRGGSKMLLEHLWPTLKMIVSMDIRMSTTGMFSDYVLPIANQYEKTGFGIPSTHTMNMTFCDHAIDPPGEAVNEYEAFRRLSEQLELRARERGIEPYKDVRGMQHDLSSCHQVYTRNGTFVDEEVLTDELIRDTAALGTIPANASLDDIREKGYYRWESPGNGARTINQATDMKPDETFAPFRNRVEKGEVWPTLTRRAQFLIDHPWFIEADEHLPIHKDPPQIGGNYPFQVASGHNRWSIHSLNTANHLMLETHRGAPHVVINDKDAESLGIEDNEEVRVFNDQGDFLVPALVSSSAQPGQVVMYNGFDPYQFTDWKSPNDSEPGMVKWLHLVGNYGHLKYWMMQWQPCPVMRNTHVGIEKIQPKSGE
ncbi:MAG: molybdopterin-dependent oxidoreductase [Gammaproteobacteria bacterium]|nr:molybdopterin-dependent oxidoreductase [Gammaproteobacteria bacterium]